MPSENYRHSRILLCLLIVAMTLVFIIQRCQGQVADGAEFVVTFREKANLQAVRGRRAVIAELKRASGQQATAALMLETGGAQFRRHFSTNVISGRGASVDLLERIALLPEVASVRPAGVREIVAEPGVERVEAPAVWSVYTRGEGVTVATIDTGVEWNHPDLEANYRGRNGNHNGAWFDPSGVCGAVPCDNNRHGTHTMGTIAGANGIGVAPGAEWITCKGCQSSSCSDANLFACGDWVLDPYGDGSGDGAPALVSNSWAGGRGELFYRDTVTAWIAAGIIPIFAAGNAGSSGCISVLSPGDYPEVITVGAFDAATGLIAGFSSLGPSILGPKKPDIAAPGVNVVSSVPGGGRQALSGTSMATPHVAGIVALLLSRDPVLTTEQVRERLTYTAEFQTASQSCGGDIPGDVPNNVWGYGIANAIRVTEDTRDELPPQNSRPIVTVTTPLQGTLYRCEGLFSKSVRFEWAGSAFDGEDGDVSSTLQWSAFGGAFSLSGPEGAAVLLYPCHTDVPSGAYEVIARASDSQGAFGQTVVSVLLDNPDYIPPEQEPPPPEIVLPKPIILSASRSGGSVAIRWIDNATNEDRWEVWESRKGRGWTEFAQVATLPANSSAANVPYMGFARYVIRSGAGSATSPFSEFAQVK